jgi:hypothetical protein
LALQAFQDPEGKFWMEVILNSPADLVVYDPQGNSCSKYECNIPEAIFSDPPQTVTLNELQSGHYLFKIIGTGNGPVTLEINGYRGDRPDADLIHQTIESFDIHEDDVWEGDVVVSSLVGPLTLDLVDAFCYPVANAGLDQTVEAEENCSTLVTLDGSGSTDCDSTSGTNDDIISFDWDEEGIPLGSGPTLGAVFPLGMHTVTLKVTDNQGNTDSDDVTITVEDTTPPVISSNAPATITPRDAPISFTATATDNCPVPIVEITECDCYFLTKKGKRMDKTESCVVEVEGATITILDSGGVDDHITWTTQATDSSGNVTVEIFEMLVVNPAK